MRFYITAFLLTGLLFTAKAQTKQEKNAIKNLCGCFEVEFKYAETFSPLQQYEFPKRYRTKALEWVTPVEENDKKIVLQHLLLAGDSVIVKHWREDWEYEKKDWWKFDQDDTWNHVTADKTPKGEWTQTVWEVTDAPRYQGSSKWIENNGQYYWENTTDAPLPRREYTKRSDYNVMQRTNKIIVTDSGYVHEQDNGKLIRKDGQADQLIAQEKGYNIYKKTDEKNCAEATAWWEKHKAFWAVVRSEWESFMKNNNQVHLIAKADGQLLYEQLDKLEEQNLTGDALKNSMQALMAKYITSEKQSSTVMQAN